MKIKPTVKTIKGRRYVHFRCVIGKNKRLGIPRRYEKTFRVQCETVGTKDAEISVGFEAQRWEQRVLGSINTREAWKSNHVPESLATGPPML